MVSELVDESPVEAFQVDLLTFCTSHLAHIGGPPTVRRK